MKCVANYPERNTNYPERNTNMKKGRLRILEPLEAFNSLVQTREEFLVDEL